MSKHKFTLFVLLFSLIFNAPAWSTPAENGRKAVSAAGTAERLSATNLWCNQVVVSAFEANTDVVVLGKSTVDATEASRTGLALFPGQTEYLGGSRSNLYEVWIDSEVNGEGASWICLN